jgi:hypothetical protein
MDYTAPVLHSQNHTGAKKCHKRQKNCSKEINMRQRIKREPTFAMRRVVSQILRHCPVRNFVQDY